MNKSSISSSEAYNSYFSRDEIELLFIKKKGIFYLLHFFL